MRKMILYVLALVLTLSPLSGRAEDEKSYKLLKKGSSGDEVAMLQENLKELGYFDGEADGVYGDETKAAVKAFQKMNGLDQDGLAGEKTQACLYSGEAVPAPEPPEPVNVLAGEYPMLVNKENTVTEDFVPADLVLLTENTDPDVVKIKYSDLKAVSTAVDALNAMLEGAREDGIVNWQISAAYRSFEDQENILNVRINSYMKNNKDWSRSRARSAALHTVALPGCSEHHTGLAFDITVPNTSAFVSTKQCKWLHEHCWEYGFIIRYPEGKEKITGYTAEAWHARYVGQEHSMAMLASGQCLEEYLEALEAE